MTPGSTDVVLRDVPLDLWARLRQRLDELRRELALVAQSSEETDGVPHRVPQLLEDLESSFGSLAAQAGTALSDAHRAGEAHATVTFAAPPSAADAAEQLLATLEEADEYCRRGELLALAADRDLVAYRTWALEEIRRQIAGQPPTPWSDSARGAA